MKKREEHKYPLNVLIDISDLDTPYLLDDELMGKLRKSKWFPPTFEVVIMSFLTQREQEMLRLYYRDLLTLQEIGDEYGISRARIGQLIKSALKKLRNPDIFLLLTTNFKVNYERQVKNSYDEGWQSGYAAAAEKVYKEAYKKGYDDCRNSRISEFTVSIDDLTDMPVEDLFLSVRTYNLLKRSEINTLKELLSWSPAKLLSLKMMGRKSYEEVVALIRSFGIDTKIYE